MLDRYEDWRQEVSLIVDDIMDMTVSEFCDGRELRKLFKLGYSPLEAFEALEEKDWLE